MDTKGVKRVWDKYKYVVLVIAVGVVLMIWPSSRKSGGVSTAAGRDIQREMEEILGKIEGVGQVRVMLTEESGGERILAEDTSVTVRREGEYSETYKTVFTDGENGDEVVVKRTVSPTYRGALVVCAGGDRASVRLAVTKAVSALTGLPASRVAVEKWQ